MTCTKYWCSCTVQSFSTHIQYMFNHPKFVISYWLRDINQEINQPKPQLSIESHLEVLLFKNFQTKSYSKSGGRSIICLLTLVNCWPISTPLFGKLWCSCFNHSLLFQLGSFCKNSRCGPRKERVGELSYLRLPFSSLNTYLLLFLEYSDYLFLPRVCLQYLWLV